MVFKTFYQWIFCPLKRWLILHKSQTNPIAIPPTSVVPPSLFLWFLLLTLKCPRAYSLALFSINTSTLGKLIQSLYTSDSQTPIFNSKSAELQTYIHNCLLKISICMPKRHLKLIYPKPNRHFFPTSPHKHTDPTVFLFAADKNSILPVAQDKSQCPT